MIEYELAVKTGSYTDREGNEKGRWENIGHIHTSQDGRWYVTLKRTFNPAGVPPREGDDRVFVSCFEPKQGRGDSAAPKAESRAAAKGKPAPTVSDYGKSGGFDDDVPFAPVTDRYI